MVSEMAFLQMKREILSLQERVAELEVRLNALAASPVGSVNDYVTMKRWTILPNGNDGHLAIIHIGIRPIPPDLEEKNSG